MGYNTRYSLKIIEEDEQNEFLQRIGVVTEQAPPINHKEIVEKRYDTWFDDSIKWYDWKKNMREYSAEHPNVLFELSGEGEENEDIWRAYFKDGLCQIVGARIIFDEYDVKKLK